jgi:hypothetical protein
MLFRVVFVNTLVLTSLFFTTKFGEAVSLSAPLAKTPPKAIHHTELCENSFAGGVYGDLNNNHEHDSNEVYLPGEITIQDSAGNSVINLQSADGLFLSTTLACETYTLKHSDVGVGQIVITENMGQDLKEFPKFIQLFLPLVAR